MKLSTWAKQNGLTYRTAWNLYHSGRLPVAAWQLETGTILIDTTNADQKTKVVIYARVSSHDQKPNLDSQVSRCLGFANKKGFSISQVVTEVGSALNGRRPKLISLLKDKDITHIVVEHRDRLMRFGSEYVEALLAAHGQQLLVVDPVEMSDDLVQDMIEVLTPFCARLYGRRAAKNRAKRALEAAAQDAN